MNERMIDRILQDLLKNINTLFRLKDVNPFEMQFDHYESERDFVNLYFKCKGCFEDNEFIFTAKLGFFGGYAIFFNLKEPTYSEQALHSVQPEDTEEIRVTKRILALVWNLYKHIKHENDYRTSTEMQRIFSSKNKIRTYSGDYNSGTDPLGDILIGIVE